jgi:hypothetical protein
MAFNIWEWDKKPILIGKLTGKVNHVPPWGRRVYAIEMDDGNTAHTWGYAGLHRELAFMPFLTRIKISYLGKAEGKSGHIEHQFDIEVLDLAKGLRKKKTAPKDENNNLAPVRPLPVVRGNRRGVPSDRKKPNAR